MTPFSSFVLSTIRDVLQNPPASFELCEKGSDHFDIAGGPHWLDETCIFENCPAETKRKLMIGFLTKDTQAYGFDVSKELSKLLAVEGRMIITELQSFLDVQDWSTWPSPVHTLSGAAHLPDSEDRLVHLLNTIDEDFRDGLFLACYTLNSREIDHRLQHLFVKWGQDHWSPSATGELYFLGEFIKRWIHHYDYSALEPVIRTYFRYI
jgi:hypothetical protein